MSVPLLAGDRGTEQTVALIRAAVNDGLSNPVVRATAMQALRNVRAFDDEAAVRAIYEWVRRNIRFTNDPLGHETISSAEWTIRHGGGDCDDINAVLLPTLLMVVGYPVELVTVNDDPTDPQGEFTHIYSQVSLNGHTIPLDAARPGARFGETIPRAFRKRVWSLTDSRYQDLAGYRGLNGPSIHRYAHGQAMRSARAGMGGWEDILNKILDTTGKVVGTFKPPSIPVNLPYDPNKLLGPITAPPYDGPGSSASLLSNPVVLLGGMGLIGMMVMMKKK